MTTENKTALDAFEDFISSVEHWGWDEEINQIRQALTAPPAPTVVLPIERFDPNLVWIDYEEAYIEMDAHPNGDWVKYKDVEPLIHAAYLAKKGE